MKSQLDMVLKDIDLSDYEIQIRNKRCKYPTANVYPNTKPPIIIIEANKPSLIRYALMDLLLHEKTHLDYIDYCESKGVCECVDHHSSVVFRMIDEGNRQVLSDLVIDEHG